MRALRDCVDSGLAWYHRPIPRPQRWLLGVELWVSSSTDPLALDLRSGDDVVATMTWPRGLGIGTRGVATAATAGHEWIFRTRGLLRGEIVVGTHGEDSTVPTLRRSMLRGWVAVGDALMPADRRLRETRSRWQWIDGQKGVLVTTGPTLRAPSGTRGSVEIASAARGLAELDLLILLAWYIAYSDAVRRLDVGGGG